GLLQGVSPQQLGRGGHLRRHRPVVRAARAAMAVVARFDFSGAQRGTHLELHEHSLVHRAPSELETIPLANVSFARVAFERNPGLLGLASALLIVALILFAVAAPLEHFAASAAADISAQGAVGGVASALLALFRVLEAFARFLPVLAAAAVVGGGAVGAFA